MIFFAFSHAHAQVINTPHKVDTLNILQRTSIRTNAFFWVIGIPNIGVEFDINNKNWNRWAVNAEVRWRPSGKDTYAHSLVYNYFEARLEGRVYWRTRQVDKLGTYLAPHQSFWDRIWSCRRKNVKHPNTVFYRGGYISYSDYAFHFFKNSTGRQGQAIQAGFTWGFVNELTHFRNGTTLDFELGVSIGPVITKYTEFTYDSYNQCYHRGKVVNWKPEFWPMVNDVHVSFVYRIGKYPLSKKYQWRYDVDLQFKDSMVALATKRNKARIEKLNANVAFEKADSAYKYLYDYYRDSNAKREQEKLDTIVPISAKKNSSEENMPKGTKKRKNKSKDTNDRSDGNKPEDNHDANVDMEGGKK